MKVHTDRTKYVIYVLWLQGQTAASIGAMTRMRRKQVLGIVQRSPYFRRGEMKDEERQALLIDLMDVRDQIAPGVFRDSHFRILPLLNDQLRQS